MNNYVSEGEGVFYILGKYSDSEFDCLRRFIKRVFKFKKEV